MAGKRATGSFYWKRSPEALAKDFEAWVQVNITSRAAKRAEALAADIVAWMRANAPWEDQTGDARRELAVDVTQTGTTIQLVLRHGVEYGIWLEIMQAGRFAIIGPAVVFWGPQLTERMTR